MAMTPDPRLLEILICPSCGTSLQALPPSELLCPSEQLAYPIVQGRPHLLASAARQLRQYDILAPDSPDRSAAS